jgi:hypothetical protein
MSGKALNRICTTTFLFGWLNFMVFCYVGQRIGGEAMHGKIEGAHYYLATGYIRSGFPPPLDAPHKYIEVSPDVFRYSQFHGYTVLVTFPLGLIACFVGVIYENKLRHELTNV